MVYGLEQLGEAAGVGGEWGAADGWSCAAAAASGRGDACRDDASDGAEYPERSE